MTNDKQFLACHTTPRLNALLNLLDSPVCVADIGCDHAYLPILLARKDISKKIIACDISEGPLERARRNVERFGMCKRIDLRLGAGLLPLKEGEADAIVIAGMGANVICEILSQGYAIAKKADFLLLQPMSSADEVRKYLYENDFIIEKEVLVREDRRIYTIICAKSGKTQGYCDADCYISPALRHDKGELYIPYLKKQKQLISSALEGMKKSKTRLCNTDYYEKLLLELDKFDE